MNLHLEDRQKLRAQSRPIEPSRDLWPAIAARIQAQPRRARYRFRWLALAASFIGIAVLAGVVGIRMMQADRARAPHAPNVFAAGTGRPADPWKPGDPRLRGAAVELRAAQGELKQALAIAPHSDYLQQLLERTERQQSHLQRLEHEAG